MQVIEEKNMINWRLVVIDFYRGSDVMFGL